MIQIQTVPETALPDLVSVPQAAEYLGVGRKMVYQLLEFGELKALRRTFPTLDHSRAIIYFHYNSMN